MKLYKLYLVHTVSSGPFSGRRLMVTVVFFSVLSAACFVASGITTSLSPNFFASGALLFFGIVCLVASVAGSFFCARSLVGIATDLKKGAIYRVISQIAWYANERFVLLEDGAGKYYCVKVTGDLDFDGARFVKVSNTKLQGGEYGLSRVAPCDPPKI